MRDEGIAQKAQNELVLSFLAVRRAIGALGFFLPLALIAYAVLWPEPLRTSLSAYYHSPMREVFVGTLMAQAVFLWSYEGFRPRAGERISDKAMARLAAVSIALVALVPTPAADPGAGDPGTGAACTLLECLAGPVASGLIHVTAAGLFFGALAVFCLVLFVRGTVDGPEKAASNRLYRLCGWTILGSIGAIGVLFATGLDLAWAAWRPVFWLETLASFAFATSWAVKGDSLRPLRRAIGAMAPPSR